MGGDGGCKEDGGSFELIELGIWLNECLFGGVCRGFMMLVYGVEGERFGVNGLMS